MKTTWIGLGIGLLGGLLALPTPADDIDIYRGRYAGSSGPVRIMLSLDLRRGTAGPACHDASSTACSAGLGERLYAQLDLYGVNRNSAGELAVQAGADGAPDLEQPDPRVPARSLAQNYWPGREVTFADTLRAALRAALTRASAAASNSPGRLEVGLMALHADDCDGAGPLFVPDYSAVPPRACSQGAYVLKGLTDISVPDKLEQLLVKLAALPDPGIPEPWMRSAWAGHAYRIRDVYFELFRYLSGQRVFNGFLGASDYGSQESGNLYHDNTGRISNDVVLTLPDGTGNQPLLAPDFDIMATASLDLASDRVAEASYVSPLSPEEECPALYLVNILSGGVSPSHEDVMAAIAAPVDAGGLGLRLAAGQTGDIALIAAMAAAEEPYHATAVPLRSYFFARDADTGAAAMAAAGGTGQAFAMTRHRELLQGLDQVFSDVFRVATTMVAGSTPIDVADRARGHGDIYFALFEAGPGPLWRGNVKKLKFAELAAAGRDSSDHSARQIIAQAPLTRPPRPAISTQDGRILRDALTFWTDPGGADVLAFDPALGEVSGRDGRSVSRGGAGQQIGGFLTNTVGASNDEAGARRVFTLDPSDPNRLLALDATATVRAALSADLDPADGLADEEELLLLRWIRGEDAFDSDGDNDRVEPRPWLLGDVIHSRPLVINYGARPGTSYSSANPEIRLFFGSNDGLFHALNNTSDHGAGLESGRESWAFIPPSMLAMQAALAGKASRAPAGHFYGMDGEAVALIDDRDGDGNIESADGDSVAVVIGQRRGGTGFYAFDVTDPDSPRFKWMIDHRTPGFDQLGLSFSTPRHARLDLGHGSPTSVLIFAGGYNGGWRGAERIGKDAGNGSDTVGNAIYVVAAGDGSLIWKAVGPNGNALPDENDQLHFAAAMTHSIPSGLAVVDTDGNGIDDRGYVGDSGGNVWRVELTEYENRPADTGARNWFVSRIARLGGSGIADRRFFHAPDVVHSRDGIGDYQGVLLVSGNRAAPRDATASNFAYLLKDRQQGNGEIPDVGSAPVLGHDELVDVTAVCASPRTPACAPQDLDTGWKLELQTPGEKGVSTPLVTNGIVLFTSYLPSGTGAAGPCAQGEGSGRVYAVQLADGAPGLPPSGGLDPVAEAARYHPLGPGIPGAVVPYGDRVLVPGKGIGGGQLVEVPGATRWRVYWREEEVDMF